MKKFLATIVLAALASPALAGDWVEIPTAPELLPGQITVGTGSLDRIIGTLSGGLADLYCISIVDEANFSATTVGGTSIDTQLFLFDANGMGVAHNDDSVGLQSTITSQFVNSNGIYFLAVSGYNRDPNSAGGLIWNNSPFGTERAPDGPGAAGALTSWTGTGANGDYTIFLTGAGFHRVPEPSALALLALGGLAMFRRR